MALVEYTGEITPVEKPAVTPAFVPYTGEVTPVVKPASLGNIASDIGKLVGAGATQTLAGAPEALQFAGSETTRDTFFKPTETLNLLADPAALTNKVVGAFGFSPIFEEATNLKIVPDAVVQEQSAALDNVLTRGKIPQLRQLTDYGTEVAKNIEDSVTPEMKQAMAESSPTGNLIKALGTGDFSELSMGQSPSAYGLAGQAAKVFGSTGTGILMSLLTKNPTVGGAFGFGQASAEGVSDARSYIEKMPEAELAQKSEYYRNLLVLGYDPLTAKEMTVDKAASTAAMAQGIVGSLGGEFTGKLITGQLDKSLLGSVQNRLGKIALGTTAGMTEEGLQELGEGVATDLGIDKTVVREIGADSFSNLILGAIGGGGPGAVTGAKAKSETKVEAPKFVEYKGDVEPITTPAPAVAPKAKVTVEAAPAEFAAAQPIPTPLSEEEQYRADMLAELDGVPPAEATKTPVERAVEPEIVAPVEQAPEAEQIIQNRNRATPASINQMNQIAGAPDYDRISFSKDFSNGAPVVAGSLELAPEQLGTESVVTSADGRKIPVQYGVVESDEILPSNNADGSVNKEFLDPSYAGLKAIAGNARTAGIQAAYERGTADQYKASMIEDNLHGIDPSVIEGMVKPVLVRIMPQDQVTNDIGDISNVATNLTLSAVEQAKNDANRVDLQGLTYDSEGNITMSTLRQFVQAMPVSEQASLIDTNGLPTKQAIDRLKAAIFSKAYDNDELIRLAHQAEDAEAKRVINSLSEVAPQMARLEGAGEYDIRPQLVQAAELAINARRNGIKLDSLVKQQDMTVDPLAQHILQIMAENAASGKKMVAAFQDLADRAYQESQGGAVDMFGEKPKRSIEQIAQERPAPEPDLLAEPSEEEKIQQKYKRQQEATVPKAPIKKSEATTVSTVTRGPDFSFNGEYIVTMENGDQYTMYRDMSGLTNVPAWRLTPESAISKEYDLLGWNKKEALEELPNWINTNRAIPLKEKFEVAPKKAKKIPPALSVEPTVAQLADQNDMIRQEKIEELKSIKQRKAAVERRFVKDKSKKYDMQMFKELSLQAKELKQEIDESYEPNISAQAFLARAAKELAAGTLEQEVYDVIDQVYKKNPALLEGLRLSVKQETGAGANEATTTAGEFIPYQRIVRLYKATSGQTDPKVIRHELTHTIEQMMPKEAKRVLVDKWVDAVTKAEKSEKSEQGKEFFVALRKFLADPSRENMKSATGLMPSYDYYQYLTPSEYWAVNAEPLMEAYLGTKWQKFKTGVKSLYEAMKNVLGISNKRAIYKTFNQVIEGKRVSRTMLNDYIGAMIPVQNIHKNYKGGPAPLASWNSPEMTQKESYIDWVLYRMQDKFVDTKRVQQAITQQVGEIEDRFNAYNKESLMHEKTAKQTQDFLKNELLPIIKDMQKNDITIQEFGGDKGYLHNRHAVERNKQIATINPELQDEGSGIKTADAEKYMENLDPAKKEVMEKLAKKVDAIIKETQRILVESGLETQETINAWNKTYKHYMPLFRENLEFATANKGKGTGVGTRGPSTRRALGSTKEISEILSNVAEFRESAIMRAERAIVGRAIYGLAIKNPNTDYWLAVNPDAVKNKKKLEAELVAHGMSLEDAKSFIQEPQQAYIDPKTGLVAYRVNPVLRNSDNVLPVRVNGKDRYVFFNPNDEQAMRMVGALKNLDTKGFNSFFNMIGKGTRWLASVNTQYNPVFGVWNFVRDVQGAALNVTSTELAGHEKAIMKDTLPALKGIYQDIRSQSKGEGPADTEWAKLWEDFQQAGGPTGYKDQFSKARREATIIEREMKNLNHGNAMKVAKSVAQWLSDYNDSMENAVRLSAYKVALDEGMSRDKAAILAKNITVNFNRKGSLSQDVGVLYAFFNASVQGSARLVETLKGPAGRKIVAGGLLIGTMQAIALAMAGFDDDDPPEFVKARNLIIPTGDGTYVMIPMPLGYNIIPTVGRIFTEMVISGGKKAPTKIFDLMSAFADAFNPIGGSGLQLIAPTVLDPFVALKTNKDAFGRPIFREDRETAPTPGYMRSRESASTFSKYLSEFLNYVSSGGMKYTKGAVSPTADEIDYLAGQVTGGVGREVMKAGQTIGNLFTGEETAPYKRPIISKLVGDTEAPSNIANKFYQNIIDMANHESEVKGRRKNHEDVTGYLQDNPEARLWQRANNVENQINKLNKEKRDLAKKEDQEDRIKRIDEKKTKLMKDFNDQVRAAQE